MKLTLTHGISFQISSEFGLSSLIEIVRTGANVSDEEGNAWEQLPATVRGMLFCLAASSSEGH